jgi:hypothetical protein
MDAEVTSKAQRAAMFRAWRRVGVFAVAAVTCLTLFSFSGCTAILGDFDVVPGTGGEGGTTGSGKGTGEACAAHPECSSGSCVDGVCCETACGGDCEKCNLPTAPGKCLPVPDGQDPDNECSTKPLPDAGVEDGGITFEDGGDDGGVGPSDAGPAFVLPDGGVTVEDNQCAGKCNGKRACAYPGTERTCGSVVCGNKREQGRASCDGEGHCMFGIEKCEAFACPDGSPGCSKTCTGEKDCLPTHFCDAQSSACKPKLQDGSGCSSVTQCKSGFCVDNVCCNDECKGYPGATCTKPGSVGKCQCNACDDGPCKLYYKDEDKDGFGDKYGTIANNRAQPGCVTGPAPAGFVGNKDDCYDGPLAIHKQARPDQTGYFPEKYVPENGVESSDWNCDGEVQKLIPEFIGASCGFCRSKVVGKFFTCGISTTASCTNYEAAGLACGSGKGLTLCGTNTATGFTTSTDCGVTKSALNCGYCLNNAITGSKYQSTQQKCH